MKKLLLISVLFFPLIFAGCAKQDDPTLVAEKFLNAMQKRDYETARLYGTKETIKLLEQFEKIEKINGPEEEEKAGNISIVSEDIKGKSAIVYFKEEGNSLEQHISLVRVEVNGEMEWRVALKKEEIRMINQPES